MKKVAKRYAQALFQYAQQENLLSEVFSDCLRIQNQWLKLPEFQSFLKNPTLNRDLVQEIFQAVAKKQKMNDPIQRFFTLLAQERRQNILGPILDAFMSLYNQALEIQKVNINSVVPLSDDLIVELTQFLTTTLAKKIDLEFQIDASLIGGFTIQAGSKFIDLSLKNQLNQLRQVLES